MKIAVLGAGYMGSAMALVAREVGHDVHLWGTWLDDGILDRLDEGGAHPRLELELGGIEAHRHKDVDAALEGAAAVLVAVTSDGLLPVLDRVASHIPSEALVATVTKGFPRGAGGRRARISEVLADVHPGLCDRWVACGGPAKAMEVARGVPTAFVFAGASEAATTGVADLFGARWVHIDKSTDLPGVECAMALKNAYATAGGLWDGLCAAGRVPGGAAHNAKAMLFAIAIGEMSSLAVALGGRAETIHGMAGVGDLHVTTAGGRNRAYGEAVGRGGAPAKVAEEMAARDQLTEGYPAIASTCELLREREIAVPPLLRALYAIVYEEAPVEQTLRRVRP